ncbi:MAG: HAD family hydrolase [archaeon]
MYKTLVTDIDGVLLRGDFLGHMAEQFGVDWAVLREAVCEPRARLAVRTIGDEPEYWAQVAERAGISEELGPHFNADAWQKAYAETACRNEKYFQMLQRLKEEGAFDQVVALSNSFPHRVDVYESEHIRLADVVDHLALSHRLVALKPDPEAFHSANRQFEIDPVRSLFVDDTRANTSAAEGIYGNVMWYARPCKLADQVVERRIKELG